MERKTNMNEKKKCVLAALYTGADSQSREGFDRSVHELRALAEAADFEPQETFIQSLDKPNAGTYIGSGKIEEIRNYLSMTDVKLVIFDSQLSPIQLRNLSDALEVTVIDRTNLILRIFSDRAKTKEARLQVDYARLQYALPRLVGMHDELSRQGGTSGAMSNRGAGETKIELDRRKIEHQIHEIKKGLDVIEKERTTQRSRRMSAGIPRVSLVGYTNAGKSTLMNAMLKAYGDDPEKEVFEENMLFATLDTTVRKIDPGKNKMSFLLSDTVGFISNLPTTLVKAFRSTLDETKYANILLIVADLSDPEYRAELDVTIKTLEEIGAGEIPRIFVFNKADLAEGEHSENISYHGISEHDGRITMSAKNPDDIQRLVDEIEEMIGRSRKQVKLLIPYTDGKCLNALKNSSNLQILDYTESGTLCEGALSEEDYQRYKKYLSVDTD